MTSYPDVTATQPRGESLTAIMVALLAACVAFQLNASMVSPALETISVELHTSERMVGLSQTVFFTLAALFSLFLPRFSDIVGRRKILAGILGVMTAGSVLCAFAPNIETFILGRAIQGASGPVIQLCLLMLRVSVTDKKQYGLLLGVITAVNGGVAGIDTIVGGFLASHIGFRSIFWVVTAISAIALALVLHQTDESMPSAGTKMDWPGVFPLVVSLTALLLGLNEAGRLDAANWSKVGLCGLVGVAAFCAFYFVEARSKAPLVAPRHLRQRATWSLLITTALTLAGVYAAVYGVVASLAQNHPAGFGMGADTTAYIFLTPFAIVGWIAGPIAGRLGPLVGYRRILRVGLALCLVCLAVAATSGIKSLPIMIACVLVMGVAYVGMANIMLNGLGIVLSPPENPGFLPGLNAGAFNLGAGLSFAALTAIQVKGSPHGSASLAGYSNALLFGAAVTAAALVASYFIPQPKNAEETE